MIALAIVGPTASGKSALALELARAHREVEIVSIDSMQVYRGMDIGTAKPTRAERAEVAHHLLDLAEPSDEFTVAEFQLAYRSAIDDIQQRGKRPVLVGGTGLYLRAVIDELTMPGRFPEVRDELEAEPDTTLLHDELAQLDPVAAGRMEPTNRRRVLRALEVTRGSGKAFSSFGPGLGSYPEIPYIQIGIDLPRSRLDELISNRYQQQMASGFVDEVTGLADRMGRTASQALGYKELLAHVEGRVGLDEALDLAVRRTKRFARRQQSWFKRDPRIRWIGSDDRAEIMPVLAGELARCSN